ncbi:alpha/beta hydrolase [Kribbella sp. NPDC005582]|uniref:alpha/beta fold hydrolase n=1 Tax=Kribbella sp. NPDC005582 TaxID=3156893 RepID=UPI0033A12533
MKDLVLLHAAVSSPATWDVVTPALTDLGYRVHTPTLLGHGSAERRRTYTLDAFRDHLIADLDHRGLTDITLIGHSLGAFVATTIAIAQPTRVNRLILEELPIPPRTPTDPGPSDQATPALLLRALGLMTRRKADPRLLHHAITALRTPNPTWWSALPTLTAPALLLTGGPTSHLTQSRYPVLASTLPTATTHEIPVGHRIHTKAPTAWLEAITPHLRS